MKPHILFFDIDGTLLDEETGQISNKTREALQEARSRGHYTFLNTGRSFAELDPKVVEVGFDGAVCGCGTYIDFHGETLLKKSIQGDKAREMVKSIEECRIDAILEGEQYFYISRNTQNEKLLNIKAYFGEEVNRRCRYWEETEPVFQKMSIWLPKDCDFAGFKEKYEKEYEFIRRDSSFYEIIPRGFSKATGIAFLSEHLGVDQENTMAIGDSTNDLAMLEYANVSIAMGNSNETLKDKVAFVTKSVKEEGVAYALSHFGFV